MVKKKILIPYIRAGFGHKMYSNAISSYIEMKAPGKYEIREMDYINEIGPASVDWLHKHIWDFMLKHQYVGRSVYALFEVLVPLIHLMERVFSGKLIKNSVNFIRDYKPDIIIATHPSTIHISIISKEKLKMDIPVVGINIEPFDGGAVYAHKNIDKLVVFSEESGRRLIKKGMPKDKLLFSDFIVRPMFTGQHDEPGNIKKKYGLEEAKTTVLMTSGGNGIGNMKKYINAVVSRNLDVQLIVITGTNTRNEKELKSMVLPQGCRTIVKALGYVDNISDFISISDVVFGKAGACTTVESLYMKKAIMFYKYVAGNEKRSVAFVRKENLGWYVPGAGKFAEKLEEILANPSILEEISKNYEKHQFKSGADELSGILIDMVESRKGDNKNEKQSHPGNN